MEQQPEETKRRRANQRETEAEVPTDTSSSTSIIWAATGNIISAVLGLGLFRMSVAIALPFILLKAHIAVVSTQSVIELPKNFCELDKRDDCQVGDCLRYDPKKFEQSPSVVTYFAGGRLGNMISAYLGLLWVSLEHGFDVYVEKSSHEMMSRYFEHIDIPVLETSLCDWKQYPWRKYEGDVELLSNPEWHTGKAIQIFMDKSNFMRQEVQGGRKFYKKYRKESMRALTFRKPYQRHAEITLEEIAKKTRKSKKLKKKDEVTFVGVHDRRTDYLEFRKKRLGLENLYEDYFQDAMEYFREEYDNPVFIYVSDDMKWGRRKLKDEKDTWFVGCGDGLDVDCIGKDLALLANCNHTITSHGSFGHWAAFLAGGEIYTEYGAIIPDAYV